MRRKSHGQSEQNIEYITNYNMARFLPDNPIRDYPAMFLLYLILSSGNDRDPFKLYCKRDKADHQKCAHETVPIHDQIPPVKCEGGRSPTLFHTTILFFFN